MEIYAPSLVKSIVIESDGDSYFAHYSGVGNLVEAPEGSFVFGATQQEALANFLAQQ